MKPPALKPRVIQAIDAVQCIRSGMDDAAIMEKFKLTAKGLQHLFGQLVATRVMSQAEIDARASLSPGSVIVDMDVQPFPSPPPTKRVIQAREAWECFKAGLDDSLIMKRFNISAKGLQSLITQLEKAGLIKASDLEQRAAVAQESVELNEIIGAGGLDDTTANKEMLGKHLEAVSIAGAATGERAAPARFEIRHAVTGELIFADEAPSPAELVRRAVAANVDLAHADLSHMNLSRVDLSGARLAHANLTKTNLAGADLTAANLSAAALTSADLFGAVLHKTNLSAADLSGANLCMTYAVWAFFAGANLAECDLTRANLCGANFSDANLFEAIIEGTNLKGAYLPCTKLDFTRGTPLEPKSEPLPEKITRS